MNGMNLDRAIEKHRILRKLAHPKGRISYKGNVLIGLKRMEPVTLTAAGIATLAFGEFIKAGAGEIAKKAVGGIEPLREAIRKRFAGHKKAEEAIDKIEKEGSTEALNKLSVYLDGEMDDKMFAQTLQQLAQQITNIQNTAERQYNNYGRDQINIENITGNPRIGGS